MKLSQKQIQAVASMLTDDPDIIVNEEVVEEWWGKGSQLSPIQQKLSVVTGVKNPKQLAKLEEEMRAFIRYRPSLQQQGEDAMIKAFATYKQSGDTPLRQSLPRDMDRLGGKDFREARRRGTLI